MKLISWNVNGLRACLDKGFLDFCAQAQADVICLQETKMQPHQAQVDLPGYHQYWNSAQKKGYSGTAVFTRQEPLSVSYDFGPEEHRTEGRVITAEYPEFYLVCCYTPNSQDGLKRLDYRMRWEDDLRAYVRTPEPYDKAGAYAIQGHAALWCAGIEGCYYNIMGLPVHRAAQLLREFA